MAACVTGNVLISIKTVNFILYLADVELETGTIVLFSKNSFDEGDNLISFEGMLCQFNHSEKMPTV